MEATGSIGVAMGEFEDLAITPRSSRATEFVPRTLPGAGTGHPPAAGGALQEDWRAEPELMTDAQLAQRWMLSRGTLANQRSQGRGPTYLKIAGRVRYRRSDIEAYELAGTVRAGGSDFRGTSCSATEVRLRLAGA